MNAVITRAAFAKFSKPLVSTKSILSLLLLSPLVAHAADTPTLNAGDTAWVLISTALVLLMTIPGLALFYSGMVRKKNILGTMAQLWCHSISIYCLDCVRLFAGVW